MSTACGTFVWTACLADARERYDVPVIEVIRPAVRRAVAVTRTGDVGVIGTSATIESGAYQDAFDAAAGVRVHAVACPSFVDFVERGIEAGLPERESWRTAFGLTVTIIWIYIELLRLLAILRGND